MFQTIKEFKRFLKLKKVYQQNLKNQDKEGMFYDLPKDVESAVQELSKVLNTINLDTRVLIELLVRKKVLTEKELKEGIELKIKEVKIEHEKIIRENIKSEL